MATAESAPGIKTATALSNRYRSFRYRVRWVRWARHYHPDTLRKRRKSRHYFGHVDCFRRKRLKISREESAEFLLQRLPETVHFYFPWDIFLFHALDIAKSLFE